MSRIQLNLYFLRETFFDILHSNPVLSALLAHISLYNCQSCNSTYIFMVILLIYKFFIYKPSKGHPNAFFSWYYLQDLAQYLTLHSKSSIKISWMNTCIDFSHKEIVSRNKLILLSWGVLNFRYFNNAIWDQSERHPQRFYPYVFWGPTFIYGQ